MDDKRWLVIAAFVLAAFALVFPATQPAYPRKADLLYRASVAGVFSLALGAGLLWLLSRGPFRRR